MKSTTILLLAGIITLASCNEHKNKEEKTSWLRDATNENQGPEEQKTVTGDFDEITVSQAIKAEVVKSDVEKVVIYAPKNIIDEVLVDNNGGSLHIHYKSGFNVNGFKDVRAKIYTKDFSKLSADSSASIEVEDKFTQDKTDVEVSSAAEISGHLEANDLGIDVSSSGNFKGQIWAVNLNVDVSSGSEVNISGKAEKGNFSASSGSSAHAKDVIVKNLVADASSGAGISVSVSQSVIADSSSGGSIDVYKKGNVTSINVEENSGGSVSVK